MTIHVFIATTRGLVAVNNLYQLPEAVANSMVTAGGFSEPCPITNGYDSFVKLGSGIIEAHFSKGPYRIDLSAKISQGNSWQLGFYIAHACKFLEILGDGNPQPGDEIIVATGSIRTADGTVAPVNHVPEKIALADKQLSPWKKQCDILFLLPVEHEGDITDIDGVTFRTINNVDYLALYLPDPAGIKPPLDDVVINALPRPIVKSEMPRKRSVKLWHVLALILVAVISVPMFLQEKTVTDTRIGAQLPVKSGPVKSASSDAGPTEIEPVAQGTPMALSLYVKRHCNTAAESLEIPDLKDNRFASTAAGNDLCDIKAQFSRDIAVVIFIGVGEERFTVKTFRQFMFDVPLPAMNGKPKQYFMITLDDAPTEQQQRSLKRFLFEFREPKQLTLEQLQSHVAELGNAANVYTHTLTPF